MLYFKDKATGDMMPFKLLIMGAGNSGKSTVIQMIKDAGVKLKVADPVTYVKSRHNCVELNTSDDFDMYEPEVLEHFSHTLFVDRATEGSDKYFDPMMMYMIDNTEDLDYLRTEIEMFLMMVSLAEMKNPA